MIFSGSTTGTLSAVLVFALQSLPFAGAVEGFKLLFTAIVNIQAVTL